MKIYLRLLGNAKRITAIIPIGPNNAPYAWMICLIYTG
jgi:hypothetical protein